MSFLQDERERERQREREKCSMRHRENERRKKFSNGATGNSGRQGKMIQAVMQREKRIKEERVRKRELEIE